MMGRAERRAYIGCVAGSAITGTTLPPSGSTRDRVAGPVERVTFHHADTGFCVLRLKVRGQQDLVMLVGHAAAIGAGEYIKASGAWLNDSLTLDSGAKRIGSR